MSDIRPPDDFEEGSNDRPSPGDSERDINSRALFLIGAVIIGAAVLIFVFVAVALNFLATRRAPAPIQGLNPLPTGAAPAPTVQLPPNPRLEVNEPVELQDVRSEWERELNTYGWIDKQHGRVRIPIDRAEEMLVQKGMPTRKGAKGTLISDDDFETGDASSGRIVEDNR